jgi:hypothetical protein
MRRLPMMNKQTAMLALQHLTGVVITNRLRAMPPAATEGHAKQYDTTMLNCAHSIIGILHSDGAKYDEQLQQPLVNGGFGLTSAVSIAPGAYLAGAETTLRHSPAFDSVWNKGEPLPPTSTIYCAIDDSLTRVKTREQQLVVTITQLMDPDTDPEPIQSALPSSANTFVQYFKPQQDPGLIQSRITHRQQTLISMARVAQAKQSGVGSEEESARLQALVQPDASLWLRTLPTDPKLTLTDKKWQWAAWLRLGIPVQADIQCCPGCGNTHAYIQSTWHSLTCIQLSGRAITDRHNEVLSRLGEFSKLIFLNPHLEPAGLDKDTKQRPDLQLALPDKTVLSDVTISHPATKTWRKVVSKKGIAAVGDQREASKVKTYQPIAQAQDMCFIAFVLYTYGGFHTSALKFIKELTLAVDPAISLISPADFKDQLKKQIAIAVQRGNANIMIQASQRHREKAMARISYKHITKRHRHITHNKQPSVTVPIRSADRTETYNTEEHDTKTPTTVDQTAMIVDRQDTTSLSTAETVMDETDEECQEEEQPSPASHRASLDALFRLMNQYMDKNHKHRGRRTHEDVEMERVEERGYMGAGDQETMESLVEEVDRIMPARISCVSE